uniref:G_PROTEIN_RECEP_F1_2 domain-containing protein n=1 Tax=Rhabditophanes sp. KR3021 TaxID=114890 RepID=A0AC35TK53_9BILA
LCRTIADILITIMFEFNLSPDYIKKYYPCDYLTPEEWEQEKEPNILLGSIYFLLGCVFLSLYVPVIYVLSKKEMLRVSSCYPLMLTLAIFDSLTLCVNGISLGIFSIRGDMLCTSFVYVYIAGIGAIFGWCTCTMLCVVLAFNRIVETINTKWSDFLFRGKKVIFWLILCFAYGLFLGLFTPPIVFTSKHYAVFFDPYVSISKIDSNNTEHYTNIPHAVHNISICIVLPSLYIFLCAYIIFKYKSVSTNVDLTTAQKLLLLQSSLICMMTFGASGLYLYFQFFPVTEALMLLAQFFWILAHGVGSCIMVFINPTIRKFVLKEIGSKIKTIKGTNSVSTTTLRRASQV